MFKKNSPNKNLKQKVLTIFEACDLELIDEVENILKSPPSKFNIDKLNENGYSCLMIAAKRNNVEIMELLLSNDADINIKGNRDMTALLIASQFGRIAAVKLLLQHDKNKIDLTATDRSGNNALMYASMYGSLQIVELLMNAGININDKNSKQGTALLFGTLYGKVNLIEFLIKNGCDINSRDQHGNTALDFATSCGYDKVIQLLKSYGAEC